jgi:hypothetical protein
MTWLGDSLLFLSINSSAGSQPVCGQVEPHAIIGRGAVMGYAASDDGTYRTGDLEPGRYRIYEQGPHRAVREVSVEAGMGAEVDLTPSHLG